MDTSITKDIYDSIFPQDLIDLDNLIQQEIDELRQMTSRNQSYKNTERFKYKIEQYIKIDEQNPESEQFEQLELGDTLNHFGEPHRAMAEQQQNQQKQEFTNKQEFMKKQFYNYQIQKESIQNDTTRDEFNNSGVFNKLYNDHIVRSQNMIARMEQYKNQNKNKELTFKPNLSLTQSKENDNGKKQSQVERSYIWNKQKIQKLQLQIEENSKKQQIDKECYFTPKILKKKDTSPGPIDYQSVSKNFIPTKGVEQYLLRMDKASQKQLQYSKTPDNKNCKHKITIPKEFNIKHSEKEILKKKDDVNNKMILFTQTSKSNTLNIDQRFILSQLPRASNISFEQSVKQLHYQLKGINI